MNTIAPLLAAATSCLALTMSASADHFTFRTIAKTGDPVPQVGGMFTDFGWPQMNNLGQITFTARRTGELATDGIWFTPDPGESTLEPVAMSNLQAPGATAGVTFDQFDLYLVRPQINDAGNLAVTLPLAGLPYENANGVFRYIDGELSKVAIAGDIVPDIGGGVMYREFGRAVGFNDNDLTAFGALLTGPGVTAANDATVYMQWFGGLTQVKREGTVAPPQGFGWMWGTNSTGIFPDALPVVQIANNGRVGFDSRVETAMGTFVSRWTGWPALLSHGTMAGNLSPQGLPFINDQNAGPSGMMLTEDGFAFVHKVDDGGEERTGVWRRTGDTIETIALEGTPGPLGTYAHIQEFSAIAAYDGTVAWPATFDLPDEDTDTAVIVKRPGEAPTVLLREGDTPPGHDSDAVFGEPFLMTAIDEDGRVYFQGYVYGPNFTHRGFWVIEPDDAVRRIIEKSQHLTLDDGVEREVEDLHVLRGLHNHAGFRPGLNNYSEVAIRVEFTDGTIAIVIAHPAEPCTGDLNADGHVDGADLAILLGAWGNCRGDCNADLNDDEGVDGADLALLLGAWGPCP